MEKRDKNKRSSGRNARNQAFKKSSKDQKSNRNKRQTGRRPFEPQEQSLVSDIDRERTSRTQELTRSLNTNERRFNLLVDSVPYLVKATPFPFNGEMRYRVSLNGGFEHVFTWDSSLSQLRAIDDEASTVPVNVEEAISEKLQSKA